MSLIVLYLSSLTVFLVLDMIGITQMIRPIFERHVGHLLADPLRLGPAAGFYAAYVAGLLYFVSVPALNADRPMQALLGGVLIGLMAYGTYEFTNLATLRDWSWNQVIVDTLWGASLTGVTAWAGVLFTRAVT